MRVWSEWLRHVVATHDRAVQFRLPAPEGKVMKTYCLGFIFDHYKNRVILIEKTKPDWQVGKINGVGGSVEEGETPRMAMAREAKEETNIGTFESDWIPIGTMEAPPDWVVHVFVTKIHRSRFSPHAIYVDEGRVDNYPISSLPHNLLASLRWLIPIALDHLMYSPDADRYQMEQFKVVYRRKV